MTSRLFFTASFPRNTDVNDRPHESWSLYSYHTAIMQESAVAIYTNIERYFTQNITTRTVDATFNFWNYTELRKYFNTEAETNGRYFPDDIFQRIFMNEDFCILIKISSKFVPKGPIDYNPALV